MRKERLNKTALEVTSNIVTHGSKQVCSSSRLLMLVYQYKV
jgi:hypothetical protein